MSLFDGPCTISASTWRSRGESSAKALLGIAIRLACWRAAHMLAHGSPVQVSSSSSSSTGFSRNSRRAGLDARRHMSTVPWPVSRTMG